jgi:hypothetical protein
MNKILYFNSGAGENAANESAAFPAINLRGFACIDATSLAIYFETIEETNINNYNDKIDLTITSGTHRTIIKAITDEIAFGEQAFITIANKDDEVFLHSGITACEITIV